MLRLGAALGQTRGTLSQSEHLERAGGIVELAVLALADVPRIPGLLGAIFRLGEARCNGIRSQPTR